MFSIFYFRFPFSLPLATSCPYAYLCLHIYIYTVCGKQIVLLLMQFALPISSLLPLLPCSPSLFPIRVLVLLLLFFSSAFFFFSLSLSSSFSFSSFSSCCSWQLFFGVWTPGCGVNLLSCCLLEAPGSDFGKQADRIRRSTTPEILLEQPTHLAGWVGAFADFGSVFGTADGVPPVCITRFSSGEGTSVFVGALKLYICHRDPTFLEQTSRFSSSTESKKEKLCEVGSSEEMTVAVGRKTFRVGPGAAKPPSLWVHQETTFVGTSAWVDRGQPTTEGTVDG